MRQASSDLFPTDVPIPASQMIGREADVDEVTGALIGGANLILAGPRRTGKTSVCDAALNRARGQGLYVASLDLFRVADTAELAETLALAVISNRSTAHRLVRRARELGRAALSAAQAAAVLKLQSQLGEVVEVALTPGWAAADPQRALDLALELPERVAVADGKRMILFFDEFQELAGDRHPYGDPDQVTKRMRAVFQRSHERQLSVRGQPRAHDARSVRSQSAGVQRLRRLSRAAADLARRLGHGPVRALRRGRLHRAKPALWSGSSSWEPVIRARRCASLSRPT